MIRVGTSGFDYSDWSGCFYPEGLPRSSWLAYYADRFSCLELNFSYYRMPEARVTASMVERTGGRLVFSIKAHRSMTHERVAAKEDFARFREAIAPLREAGCLGAVLAQFPQSFRQCEENRSYLRRLADELERPLAVELRSAPWATEPVLEWLGRLGVGFVCVDEPPLEGLMPPLAVFTAPPAYVRFHGRNEAKWYVHDRPEERYDYRYSENELRGWALKIKSLETSADNVFVFFNNHFQAKAVDAARAMKKLLAGR